MPARKPRPQLSLLEARSSTAPCVPAIREAVEFWRKGGCKGATPTTRLLLLHWFHTDHILPNKTPFAYHASQREAIETLVYLCEVSRTRPLASLLQGRKRARERLDRAKLALPQGQAGRLEQAAAE